MTHPSTLRSLSTRDRLADSPLLTRDINTTNSKGLLLKSSSPICYKAALGQHIRVVTCTWSMKQLGEVQKGKGLMMVYQTVQRMGCDVSTSRHARSLCVMYLGISVTLTVDLMPALTFTSFGSSEWLTQDDHFTFSVSLQISWVTALIWRILTLRETSASWGSCTEVEQI